MRLRKYTPVYRFCSFIIQESSASGSTCVQSAVPPHEGHTGGEPNRGPEVTTSGRAATGACARCRAAYDSMFLKVAKCALSTTDYEKIY